MLAKKFGVNEFVNPKDHDRPVQEVGNFYYLTALIKLSMVTMFCCMQT